MHERYLNPVILETFSDKNKLLLWQRTELAVIQAMADLGRIDKEIYDSIFSILDKTEIDIADWKARDKKIHHDLNAFLEERLQHIPIELQEFFHKQMTSYDTEEPAFVTMLEDGLREIVGMALEFKDILKRMALEHRYTVMLARTHGQGAEVQSFGKRILTWYQDFMIAFNGVLDHMKNLGYAKLSGAIGNYSGIDPEIEARALEILGYEPHYGATQIMPRVLYAGIGQGVCNMVMALNKIAMDIRLGARSGLPIFSEPFGKKQKGSSAMPGKKNTINTEQVDGMARMAKGYMVMITDNIVTWEERDIDQSCVERVAWPDLFHVCLQSLKVMNNVVGNLVVYKDNMLEEIKRTRGTYACAEAKEFLKPLLKPYGLDNEDVYRLVQLACFNVFEVREHRKNIRNARFGSYAEAMENMNALRGEKTSSLDKLRWNTLHVSEELEIDEVMVERYNRALISLFKDKEAVDGWHRIFTFDHQLRNENILFEKILSE